MAGKVHCKPKISICTRKEGSIQGIENIYKHHLDCHYVDIIVDTLHKDCCNQVFPALFTMIYYATIISFLILLEKKNFGFWFMFFKIS